MGLTGGGGVVEARACRIDGGNDGILELRERCAQFNEDVHGQRVWVELWRLAHPQLLNNKHLHLNRPPAVSSTLSLFAAIAAALPLAARLAGLRLAALLAALL